MKVVCRFLIRLSEISKVNMIYNIVIIIRKFDLVNIDNKCSENYLIIGRIKLYLIYI